MDGMAGRKIEQGALPKRYIPQWEEVPVPEGKHLKPGYIFIRMLTVEQIDGGGVMAASWGRPMALPEKEFFGAE